MAFIELWRDILDMHLLYDRLLEPRRSHVLVSAVEIGWIVFLLDRGETCSAPQLRAAARRVFNSSDQLTTTCSSAGFRLPPTG